MREDSKKWVFAPSDAGRVGPLLARIAARQDLATDVRRRLRYQSQAQRRKCLAVSRFVLASREMRQSELLQVSAAKVLVAALPASFESIRGLLNVRSGKDAFDVHFALFVFLSEIGAFDLRPAERDRAVELMIAYLRSARVRTAQAAWMAGQALGDLCNERTSGALAQLAVRAKYAAARSAAVSGLGVCVDKLPQRSASRSLAVIRRVARADRSNRVRASAAVALRLLRASGAVSRTSKPCS